MIITTVEQLSKINNILSCTICKEVFRAPVITSTCHHVFCSVCIRKSLNQGLQYCPVCNTELFESYLNKCTIIEEMSLWFSNWILYNKDQNQKQILVNQRQMSSNHNDSNNDIIDKRALLFDSSENKQNGRMCFHNDLETNLNAGGYYYISRKLTDPKRTTNSNKSQLDPNKTITNLLRNKKSRVNILNSDSKSPQERDSSPKILHNNEKNDENIEIIDLAEDGDNIGSQIDSSSTQELSIINETSSLIENEIIEISSQEQMNSNNLKSRKRRRLAGFIKNDNPTEALPLEETKTEDKECQGFSLKSTEDFHKEIQHDLNKEIQHDFNNEKDREQKLQKSDEKTTAGAEIILDQDNPEFIGSNHDEKKINEELQQQLQLRFNPEKKVYNNKLDSGNAMNTLKNIHDQLMEENNVLSGINVVEFTENKANQHLTVNKQSRIPKLDLSKLNTSKVKEKFRQHNIPLPSKYPEFSKSKTNNNTVKEHKYLQNYFNQYYILWNSNLDTEFPLSKAEIMAQIKQWERFQILQEHNNAMKRDFSEVKKVESSAWILKYKNEFQELILRAKSTKAEPN